MIGIADDRDRDTTNDRQQPAREKSYGIVLSLKETFGFILPYSGDEHLYFNERDGKLLMLEIVYYLICCQRRMILRRRTRWSLS
jgi:hypothetical protein